jgi:membrane-associated phospholipid phosphatase
MGISFYAMEHAVPLLGLPKVDGRLLAWDRALLGETPALAWGPWLRPWLVDVSMAAYLFFFYYLIAGPGRYYLRDLAAFRKCIVGLFVLYGLGFIGYTIFPAGGPHRFMTFNQSLEGSWLLGATLNIVNGGSNGVDAFPSIHFAATLYLLLFDWQHCRRRFWWMLAPCAMLWFSTMYLRFHYFVDLAGGLVVALIGWVAAQWFERNWSATAERGGILSARTPQQSES